MIQEARRLKQEDTLRRRGFFPALEGDRELWARGDERYTRSQALMVAFQEASNPQKPEPLWGPPPPAPFMQRLMERRRAQRQEEEDSTHHIKHGWRFVRVKVPEDRLTPARHGRWDFYFEWAMNVARLLHKSCDGILALGGKGQIQRRSRPLADLRDQAPREAPARASGAVAGLPPRAGREVAAHDDSSHREA